MTVQYGGVHGSLMALLNIKQAAHELGLSPSGVKYRILTGAITAEKVGDGRTSQYAITTDEIERVKNATASTT